MGKHLYTSIPITKTEVVDKLADLQRRMENDGIVADWYSKEELHLTVNYLGPVEEFDASEIEQVRTIFNSAGQQDAVRENIWITGVNVFLGDDGLPAVVFARVAASSPLRKYRDLLQVEFEKAGLFRGNYAVWSPHITLGLLSSNSPQVRIAKYSCFFVHPGGTVVLHNAR